MIRKLKSGEYRLYSKKKDPKTGKRRNLGTFETCEAAEKHEQKVLDLKRKGKGLHVNQANLASPTFAGYPARESQIVPGIRLEGQMMDVATVMKEVGNWPVEDRLRLIEQVWGSLTDHPPEITLSDAHRQDLQRRLEAYRDNPKAGSPWEEVEARLRGHGR